MDQLRDFVNTFPDPVDAHLPLDEKIRKNIKAKLTEKTKLTGTSLLSRSLAPPKSVLEAKSLQSTLGIGLSTVGLRGSL